MKTQIEVPSATDAPQRLAGLLQTAIDRGASDVHVEPTADACEVRNRIDGMLQTVARIETDIGRAMVGRLMVLSQLLTYRLDVPLEGRFGFHPAGENGSPLELRLAIMPTTHGLRAAVRLPSGNLQPGSLAGLGLPASVLAGLERFARADAGMLILTGPAGSGMTTTTYALLQHVAQTQPGLSLISLEDPVERDLPGVTQIEVKPFGEMTYERADSPLLFSGAA